MTAVNKNTSTFLLTLDPKSQVFFKRLAYNHRYKTNFVLQAYFFYLCTNQHHFHCLVARAPEFINE